MLEPNEATLGATTLRRVELLRHLADFRNEPYAAEQMSISVSGVRSHVEDLKIITGCESVADLGRWWLANRHAWLELIAGQLG